MKLQADSVHAMLVLFLMASLPVVACSRESGREGGGSRLVAAGPAGQPAGAKRGGEEQTRRRFSPPPPGSGPHSDPRYRRLPPEGGPPPEAFLPGPDGFSEHQWTQTFPRYPPEAIDQMGIYPTSDNGEFQGLARHAATQPGWTVADIGCGGGRFTFPLARLVGPDGRVYAADIQETVLEVVRGYLGDQSLNPYDNIKVLRNRPDDALLPAESLDQAWLLRVHFHSFANLMPENKRMLDSVFKAVKPGGTVLIKDGDEPGQKRGEARRNIIRNYIAAGFEHLEGKDITDYNGMAFVVMFRKPG